VVVVVLGVLGVQQVVVVVVVVVAAAAVVAVVVVVVVVVVIMILSTSWLAFLPDIINAVTRPNYTQSKNCAKRKGRIAAAGRW